MIVLMVVLLGKKINVVWDFEVLNPEDYRVVLNIGLANNLWSKVLVGAVKRTLGGDHHLVLNRDYPVPKEYFSFVKTKVSDVMRQVARDVLVDGLKVVSFNVVGVVIRREKVNGRLLITIEGLYSR